MDTVVIIGATLSGLATSLCLNLMGIQNVLLERADATASYWKLWTYERIKFRLIQTFCMTPGLPHPSTGLAGKDITRHKDEYNRVTKVTPLFCQHVTSPIFRVQAGHWDITVTDTVTNMQEVRRTKFIVFATGENNQGLFPDYPDLERFTGEIVHSIEYTGGVRYAGKRVLVTGVGEEVGQIYRNLASFEAVPSWAYWQRNFHVIRSVDGNAVTFFDGNSYEYDAIILAMENNTTLEQQNDDQILPWNGLYRSGHTDANLASLSADVLKISQDISISNQS